VTAQGATAQGAAAQGVTGETGSIYDLGYRRYEGPRLGRAHAVRSLFAHTLRSTFGIGRGGRAKIAPVALLFLVSIPAVAIIAAQALLRQFPGGEGFGGQLPVRFETYASTIGVFVVLFCAAQAPDLFGRDQRHKLLALYFSRALRRTDYALARIGGFMVAVLILQLLPQLILFLGQVLLSTDVGAKFLDDLPSLAKAAAQAVLTAGLLGGLSMAVSAFTPRRAYAVAGIIALFVIPSIVTGIVIQIGSTELGTWLLLLSPTSVLEGTNGFLFHVPITSGDGGFVPFIAEWAYLAAAVAGIAGSVAVAVRRFQRMTV
jgi:ABC-2 type transport system permease protein